MLRTRALPISTEDREQLLGEHYIAISASFAMPDMNDHPGAIDVLDRQRDRFSDAQTRRIDRGQGSSRLEAGHCLEKADDLLRREHGRGSGRRGGEICSVTPLRPRVVL